MIEIFYLSILLIFIFIVASIVWYSWLLGITPTPTSYAVQKQLFLFLPYPPLSGLIIELGSGWGNLTFALASHFPNNQILAYERSLIPYLFSLFIKVISKNKTIIFERKDFFFEDLSKASLIVCYLYPKAMQRLKIKFEKELKPGTWIVSHTFAITGWKPIHVSYASDLYQTPIYYYLN